MSRMKRAFAAAVEQIRKDIPPEAFKKFIKPLEMSGIEEHVVFVSTPGAFVLKWVNAKFREKLESALSEAAGMPVEIVLEARASDRKHEPLTGAIAAPTFDERPTDCFRFDNFVVGPSNAIAYNGARSVAEAPGKFCNPLFLYGKTGLGKTHLLWAIANQIKRDKPRLRIDYMTAQDFANRFVDALDRGAVQQFRRQITAPSILLVDDIGFVEGKSKTQEELFHAFNDLLQSGKQLVISSDKPPRDHARLEERLRSRMESGLVADIQPPDIETRAAIVRAKAAEEGVNLSKEVCEVLAVGVPGSVRTLLGALKTLLVHATWIGHDADPELARKVIENQFGRPVPTKPSPDQILRAVSAFYRVSIEDLLSPTRKAWIAHARHVAIFLIKETTDESWKRLGERFGNRDHSSIIHAYKKISLLAQSDDVVRQEISGLRDELHLGA